MKEGMLRAVGIGILGAITGAGGLAAAYGVNPDVAFDMDRDLPRLVSGFYPVERSGTTTFAWASRSATLSLPDVDRRAPWTCAVHFRGGRVDETTQPMVELTIDGIPLASRLATNSYEVVEATAPPARSPGLLLAITSSTTFVPGPADRRELAIQVDSFVCRPPKGEIVLPPRRAITAAAIGGAVFGLAFGLSGLSFGAAAAGVLVLALVQALPLAAGTAPFMRAAPPAAALSCWIALTTLLVARVLEWRNGEPLRHAARFVLLFTAAALYIKLLGLLHPSKLPVDVVFQAHRLEWVLNGRFFFTQPLPSGVQFPYAIALYVFAAPWSLVTRDYVALLRIVVCACEAAAGGLLYVMIARTWHDRGAGAVAVVLFSLVPISYGVLGNANLTNAFGQSASLIVLAAATIWSLQGRAILQTVGLALLTAIALLSHVSTFAQLSTTLLALAGLLWVFAETSMRGPARAILLATFVATILSVVLYYGHFGEVYQNLGRARAPTAAAEAAPGSKGTIAPPMGAAPVPSPLVRRVSAAADWTVMSIGWPILLLAGAGAWRVWLDGTRDRLVLLIAAMGIAFLVFVAGAIVSPVSPSFERYATEFVGRAAYAANPAAVILAGRGAAWAWRAGALPRLVSAGLVAAAVVGGTRFWLAWFV